MNKNHIRKDRFYSSRGSCTALLIITCARCAAFICVYQKDGKGNLHRLYIDRIIESNPLFKIPDNSSTLTKKSLPNLLCACNALIGVPIIYTREDRLAFRLIHGTIHKKQKI